MKDTDRSSWNSRQKQLRMALEKATDFEQAIELLLVQHALVHENQVSSINQSTLEDQLWVGLSEDTLRRIPNGQTHSILWCIWHITRCEDITMNCLVNHGSQVLSRESWFDSMGVPQIDTGNGMNDLEMVDFTSKINVPALREYRKEVGQQTREIVKSLKVTDLQRKSSQDSIAGLLHDGAVLESQRWLVDYWAKQSVAGILLMPPTRHSFVHINEAQRLKVKLSKIPIE